MPEPTLTVGSDTIALRVTTDESDGTVVAYDAWLPPGGGPPALHRHAAFELFRVECGELAFYLEDTDGQVARGVACAGDVVAIPGGREHTVRNESSEQAQAFVVLSPGAAMEGFARVGA
jgi:mannose-6-phosphate isomerase-like protein (cupin superfamily)